MTRAMSPVHRVPQRRRREGKTNYAKRLALIKSGMPRLVVRRSNRYVQVQFIEYADGGDRTILTVNAAKLEKEFKWPAKRNVWTAYLTGLYAGKQAAAKGVKAAVLDIGMHVPSRGSILFAALRGAVDAGVKASVDDTKVPSEKLAAPPEALKRAFGELKAKIQGAKPPVSPAPSEPKIVEG